MPLRDQGPRLPAVYMVHATQPDATGAVEVIHRSENDARDRSRDDRILSAAATRFPPDVLGTRQPVAWCLDGHEPPLHVHIPGHRYTPDG